mgnify:CR=1 FL=1
MDLERIIELRTDNDLTQTDLGNIVDNKKSTVSNWENGNEIIPIIKLFKIAEYFNVSIDYLLKLSNVRRCFWLKKVINKNTVGNRIKEIRKDNNLTQRGLAKMLNTSHSTLSAYENGKTLILSAFAYQICYNYGVSFDWLLGLSDKKINNTVEK